MIKIVPTRINKWKMNLCQKKAHLGIWVKKMTSTTGLILVLRVGLLNSTLQLSLNVYDAGTWYTWIPGRWRRSWGFLWVSLGLLQNVTPLIPLCRGMAYINSVRVRERGVHLFFPLYSRFARDGLHFTGLGKGLLCVQPGLWKHFLMLWMMFVWQILASCLVKLRFLVFRILADRHLFSTVWACHLRGMSTFLWFGLKKNPKKLWLRVGWFFLYTFAVFFWLYKTKQQWIKQLI